MSADKELTFFISGHLDLTAAEFEEHYKMRILGAVELGAGFVVGDARGTDDLAQKFLRASGARNVRVFHMFEFPRFNNEFQAVGGFTSDENRDAAMTAASTSDIAWVRPGREKSGTAKNLARRLRGRP
jgi:hypothetical protein